MLYELRVSVSDRPGSLARLTQLLADQQIDVREIDILGSIVGQAVDVLLVDCTTERAALLGPLVGVLDGFTLLSLQPAHQLRSSHPELDLLSTLTRPGDEAVRSFTETAVPTFSADWAMAFALGRAQAQFSTAKAPAIGWNGWTPKRATRVLPGVYTVAPEPYEAVHVPLGTRHILLLGRTGGPAFHDLEVMRVNRLLEVAGSFVELTVAASVFGPSGSLTL